MIKFILVVISFYATCCTQVFGEGELYSRMKEIIVRETGVYLSGSNLIPLPSPRLDREAAQFASSATKSQFDELEAGLFAERNGLHAIFVCTFLIQTKSQLGRDIIERYLTMLDSEKREFLPKTGSREQILRAVNIRALERLYSNARPVDAPKPKETLINSRAKTP